MTQTRVYEGSCHCGAVRFRFTSEPITSGLRCNCSICIRRGAVMSSRYYPPTEFELVAGAENLAVYIFGDRMVNQWFCKTCGIYPFHDPIETPGHYRVNLGCVDGVDPLSLSVDLVDGKSF